MFRSAPLSPYSDRQRRLAAPLLCCAAIATAPADVSADPVLPPQDEIEAVKERFIPLQHLSFAAGFEYCGYLAMAAGGKRVFTEMLRGGHNGCTPEMPDDSLILVASMHTHGAYDPSVPAEFPTVLDMESDRLEGVNGYVATPGGRLWYIDSRSMITFQVCGLNCLPQDPHFHAGDDGEIASSYTYRDLQALEWQD